MLLDLYVDIIGNMDLIDLPGIYQVLIIFLYNLLGLIIALIDIILFPIEFFIWFIKERIIGE